MKSKSLAFLSSIFIILSSAHAADTTLTAGSYADTQSYNNGTISGVVVFNSGANYTFDSLSLPLAWNRITLNSGASLNVAGNISTNISGLSLNGGTLTTGGLLVGDAPWWNGALNDGKQTLEYGDTVINGSTIIANQSNANFISKAYSPEYDGVNGNYLWINGDGATIDSNGFDIGSTMNMWGSGSLTKVGTGTLTLTGGNTYSGGTTVNQGTLLLSGSARGYCRINGALTVNSGAEVNFTNDDGTGLGWINGSKVTSLTINGGKVSSASLLHIWNFTGGIHMTGGTLQSNGGVSDANGHQLEWNSTSVTTHASTETATIGGRIRIRADGGYTNIAFDVEDGAAATDLLVSAAITEASSGRGITKTGAGTMVLSGANNYTGGTTISAGVLSLANPVLDDIATVTIASGAVLDLNFSGTDTVGNLEIAGSGPLPAGIYDASHPLYGGYFTGTGSLIVAGSDGVWTSLSPGNWGDAANWDGNTIAVGYNATATFNAAAGVEVAVASNRKIGNMIFDVSDYTITGPAVLALDAAAPPYISVASGRTATISAGLEGALGMKKTGDGTLVLTGVKSYTGGTVVTSGTLELANGSGGNSIIRGPLTISPGATVSITGGDGSGFGWNNPVTTISVDNATLKAPGTSHIGFGAAASLSIQNGSSIQGNWQWNGDGSLTVSSSGDATNTISGALVLRGDSGANHTFNVNDGTSAIDLQIDANLSDQWPEVTWVSASGLTKSGAGTLVLNGTNSYDNNTVVNDGALEVTAASGLQFRPTSNGASNKVSGSSNASLSFLGTVHLELGGADLAHRNAWTLFDLASFTGSTPVLTPTAVTSSLGSFTEVTSGTWELAVTNAKWVFTESNGQLTYLVTATDYDNWKSANGVIGGENDDDDSDGLTNFEEYAFGLDPTGNSSVSPITAQLDKNTGTFSYQRRKSALATNLTYTVQTSTDLATWIPDATASQSATDIPSSDNESVSVTLSAAKPLASGKLFVRVVVASAAP